MKITDETPIVMLTVGQLREILIEVIETEKSKNGKSESKNRNLVSLNDALAYLNGKGIKMSKSTIYKRTMEGIIPFKRFGMRKIVFNLDELDNWVDEMINKRR